MQPNIDKMPAGVELGALCAQAMGWAVNGDVYVTDASTMIEAWKWVGQLTVDIAAAFTLHKPGWTWVFEEDENSTRVDVGFAYFMWDGWEDEAQASTEFSETNDNRPAAYALAIARCIAKWWLAQSGEAPA